MRRDITGFGSTLVAVLLGAPTALGQAGQLTDTPRQVASWELPYQKGQRVVWSPDGTALAVSGFIVPPDKTERLLDFRVISDLKNAAAPTREQSLPRGAWLIGFTRDGKSVVSDLRQYGIANGVHRLTFWDKVADDIGNDAAIAVRKSRSIDLDSDRSMWYTFAADDRTFRTVHFTEGLTDGPNTMKVCDVSTTTGRTVKTLMRLDGRFATASLSANGARLATISPDGLTEVWDVATGTKEWTVAPNPTDPLLGRVTEARISQDARLLFVIQNDKPRLFDIGSGTWGPVLQWTGRLRAEAFTANGFSADGRLFVYNGLNRVAAGSTEDEVLIVWDTATGKVLKTWDRVAPAAVSPTRPMLAVLEPNGGDTRLTLWDFTAERGR